MEKNFMSTKKQYAYEKAIRAEYADPFNLFQREYGAQFGISTSKPEPTPMELTRSYKEAVKD
jgi:hypothetical protein